MDFNAYEIRYLSSDGEHNIYAKFIEPKGEIKGILQISHGMNGYIGKYDEMAMKMVNAGYVLCGNTHLGHRDSANSKEDLGFFGEFDGYKHLIKDTQKFTEIIKKRYPEKDIYLFGHSMGSLVARCCAYKNDDRIKGLILSGTIGPNLLVDSGIQLTDLIIQQKGYRYRSRKLYKVMFDAANRRVRHHTSEYDWVTSKKELVENRILGKNEDFLFTVTGLRDVLFLIRESNDFVKIKKINKDLPIYFFAGSEDPVGDYGLGVRVAAKLYKDAKINDVTCKIYKGDRHECFNEKNADEVVENMIKWIVKHNKGEKNVD